MPATHVDQIRECLDWASRDEARHCLIVTLLARGLRDPVFRSEVYLNTVRRGQVIAALSLRTGAHPKLSVSNSEDDDAVIELAGRAFEAMPDLPCVLGPEKEARLFASTWAKKTGVDSTRGMLQRIYRLDTVSSAGAVPGKLRKADRSELELLTTWVAAFNRDSKQPTREPVEIRASVRDYIDQRSAFVWDNQGPVSLLTAAGPAGRVARIGYVYTPPGMRRMGYASAAVAAASQLMFDAGHSLCCLYTDRSNPTSNHIYRTVGYRPVCEVEEYWLRPAQQ